MLWEPILLLLVPHLRRGSLVAASYTAQRTQELRSSRSKGAQWYMGTFRRARTRERLASISADLRNVGSLRSSPIGYAHAVAAIVRSGGYKTRPVPTSVMIPLFSCASRTADSQSERNIKFLHSAQRPAVLL